MRKFLLLLTVLTMLFSLSAVASAQDMMGDHSDFVFCGALSEEDCAMYEEFQGGLVPDSTLFDMNVAAVITADGTDFEVGIVADGGYVYDVEVVREYMDSIADLPLLEVNTETWVGFFEAGITAFDAELNLDIELPPMFAFMLPTTDVNVSLWLIDGIAYADLTPIGVLAEDESLTGVYGIDTFEIIRMGLSEVTMGDLFDLIEESDLYDGEFDQQGAFRAQQQFMAGQITDPEEIAEFVTLTRLEDGEVDGVETAVFETTVDIAAIFENEAVIDAIELNIPPEAQDEFDVEELAEAMVEAFAGSSVTVVEQYGIEDGYLYASDTTIDVVVDPNVFQEFAMEMEMETMEDDMMATEEAMMEMEELDPIEVFIESSFERSSINAVEEITLPEGAEVVPTEDLFAVQPDF